MAVSLRPTNIYKTVLRSTEGTILKRFCGNNEKQQKSRTFKKQLGVLLEQI
jgi:hypothetical protein